MKKILFIFLALILGIAIAQALPEINTNTALSIDNIGKEIKDVSLIVDDWKAVSESLKSGWTLALILTVAALALLSLSVLGVIAVMVLNLVEFFTPPDVDIKLDEVEEFITKWLIKLPISIVAKLRGSVVKK